MLCPFHYAQIIIGFHWFLTTMAIYPSIWVAPSNFQHGENFRIIYVHVLAAWMNLLIYIAMAISSVLFLLTKHPIFHLFSKTSAKIGALFTLFTLITRKRDARTYIYNAQEEGEMKFSCIPRPNLN